MMASPAFRNGFAVLVFFTVLAGDAWRYSISWYGFGAVAIAITTIAAILLVRERRLDRWNVGKLPYPLLAFLLLATVSIAWSHYRGATAIGLLVTWMTIVTAVGVAVTYSWREILNGLAAALRIILGLSLVFELVVATLVRAPLLPFWVDYGDQEKLPKLLYWSRNELFEVFDGGKIQGIVGNSSLLGFVALLGLIVFGLRLAEKRGRGFWPWFWLGIAGLTVLFTRSATITIAIAACAFVVLVILAIRRSRSPRGRAIVYGVIAGAAAAGIAAIFLFSSQLLGVLGKSDDLTGRLLIWERVIGLAQERPAFGWGWISYWMPWVDPFDSLVVRSGVLQLHAHNAWLDVWMQLGVAGLIVFGALVLFTLLRSWTTAVDRPQSAPDAPGEYTVVSMLPILLLVALLVQSVAESRLLVEYGMLLLVITAVKTRSP